MEQEYWTAEKIILVIISAGMILYYIIIFINYLKRRYGATKIKTDNDDDTD